MDDYPAERTADLERLRAEALGCVRCPLARTRTQVVFGEGNPTARLMIVGEAPGEDEDRAGRPFVGVAGQTLDGLLREAGIERAEAWVTNTVLCRPVTDGPVRNRPPRQGEVETCAPFLDAQLGFVRPAVIVALGAIAARRLLGPDVRLEDFRGDPVDLGRTLVVPTFHPSALRWGAGRREAVVADLRQAQALAGR